jgi:hypothetical protein
MSRNRELTAMEEIEMRTWFEKLQRIAAASAFAEMGEWQTARGIMEESDKRLPARDVERKSQSKTRLRERSYHV